MSGREQVLTPARVAAFAAVVVVAAASATIYVAGRAGERSRAQRAAAEAERSEPHLDPAAVRAVPHLVFRDTRAGTGYGRVAMVPLTDPGGPRATTGTECERVYATARAGLCLSADRGVVTRYHGAVLGPDLAPVRDVKVLGGPSRTRLSPDSRLAASTVFVAGHSYTETGFSTVTEIVDVATGRSFGNLERFRIVKDGRDYTSADVNFWGVTFAADGTTFYASLGTRGHTYLVRGDLDRREVRTVRDNAECPSLSPDGRHLVYKKRVGSGAVRWRLTVLDLATGTETALPERRSVDDQAAWLDDRHVLYAVTREEAGTGQADVWVSPLVASPGDQPRLLVADATSPSVVR